jgi:hypothetical protein
MIEETMVSAARSSDHIKSPFWVDVHISGRVGLALDTTNMAAVRAFCEPATEYSVCTFTGGWCVDVVRESVYDPDEGPAVRSVMYVAVHVPVRYVTERMILGLFPLGSKVEYYWQVCWVSERNIRIKDAAQPYYHMCEG